MAFEHGRAKLSIVPRAVAIRWPMAVSGTLFAMAFFAARNAAVL
ncbi:MAG: hypothetical protein WBA66_01330 [Xanthobacteraceae bacterium]